jgi:hypothetical protein
MVVVLMDMKFCLLFFYGLCKPFESACHYRDLSRGYQHQHLHTQIGQMTGGDTQKYPRRGIVAFQRDVKAGRLMGVHLFRRISVGKDDRSVQLTRTLKQN